MSMFDPAGIFGGDDGGGGGGGGGDVTSYSTTLLPGDLENWRTISDETMRIFQDPWVAYGVDPETGVLDVDKRISDWDPSQLNAFDATSAMFGAGDPLGDEAIAQLGIAKTLPAGMTSSYIPQDFRVEDMSPETYAALGNPYTENVLDNVLRRMEEDQARSSQRTAAERVASGTEYGLTPHGSGRANLARTLADSEHVRNKLEASEGMYSKRHDDIMDLYKWSREAADDAAYRGAGLDLDAKKMQFGANRLLASDFDRFAGTSQDRELARIRAEELVGAKRQAKDQAELDLRKFLFESERNYPKEQIGFASGILRGIPSPVQYTASGAPSIYSDILGAYGAGQGIASYQELFDEGA